MDESIEITPVGLQQELLRQPFPVVPFALEGLPGPGDRTPFRAGYFLVEIPLAQQESTDARERDSCDAFENSSFDPLSCDSGVHSKIPSRAQEEHDKYTQGPAA